MGTEDQCTWGVQRRFLWSSGHRPTVFWRSPLRSLNQSIGCANKHQFAKQNLCHWMLFKDKELAGVPEGAVAQTSPVASGVVINKFASRPGGYT